MNLHGVARGVVAAVNPQIPLVVRISTGPVLVPGGKQVPSFATPSAFTGSIASNVLTVSAITVGRLALGQALAGTGITANTKIIAYGTGTGGVGTYILDTAQTVLSEAIVSTLTAIGQVQPLTYRDIEHLSGLNIQGYQRGIYINGTLDGLVRIDEKGGDLIQTPDGRWWLVTLVLEQWPDWVKVAVTLQDQAP